MIETVKLDLAQQCEDQIQIEKVRQFCLQRSYTVCIESFLIEMSLW